MDWNNDQAINQSAGVLGIRPFLLNRPNISSSAKATRNGTKCDVGDPMTTSLLSVSLSLSARSTPTKLLCSLFCLPLSVVAPSGLFEAHRSKILTGSLDYTYHRVTSWEVISREKVLIYSDILHNLGPQESLLSHVQWHLCLACVTDNAFVLFPVPVFPFRSDVIAGTAFGFPHLRIHNS